MFARRFLPLFPSLLACAAVASAAAITDDFSGYRAGETLTTGQTLGAEALGWLDGWRTASSYVTTRASVKDTSPLDAGAYFHATITSTPGQPVRPSGAIARPYTPPDKPFTLRFHFRPANVDPNIRYILFDNDARAAGTSPNASWQIQVADGRWQLIGGGASPGETIPIHTDMLVTAGTTYVFTISLDPATRRWSATIFDGQRSITHKDLGFRTATFTTERWLHFGASELGSAALGLTAEWSLDSISIQP